MEYDWRNCVVRLGSPVLKTLEIIDRGGIQFALVVDEHDKFIGAVTDGDIRRGILKGIRLEEPVELVMNTKPITVSESQSRTSILAIMRENGLRQIPVLDKHNHIVRVEIFSKLEKTVRRDNPVILMAGGLGTRLRPLTDTLPKPLISIGDRPLLETILNQFILQGFHRFFFSVNYRREMIEDYFKDGSQWGVEIEYLKEDQRLGTAGALSLFSCYSDLPLIVMNGDLLTKINFHHLLDFHTLHSADATMCVREYDFQVPFGVVSLKNEHILSIDEKPIHRFFVNAGIYVLNPSVLQLIQSNEQLDMPHLFNKMRYASHKLLAFPLREYWLDVGRMDDFEKARDEFSEIFMS